MDFYQNIIAAMVLHSRNKNVSSYGFLLGHITARERAKLPTICRFITHFRGPLMIKFPQRIEKKKEKEKIARCFLAHGKIRTKQMIVRNCFKNLSYLPLSRHPIEILWKMYRTVVGLREFQSVLKKFREFMDRLSNSAEQISTRSIFGRDTFRFAIFSPHYPLPHNQ